MKEHVTLTGDTDLKLIRDELSVAGDADHTPAEQLWNELLETFRKLQSAKPNDRSELDRRHAVAITKYQDFLSWYHTMILSDFEG